MFVWGALFMFTPVHDVKNVEQNSNCTSVRYLRHTYMRDTLYVASVVGAEMCEFWYITIYLEYTCNILVIYLLYILYDLFFAMFSLSCLDKTSPVKWPKETALWGTWSWLWMMPRVPAVKWRRVKCQSTQSAQNMGVKIHRLPPKNYGLVTRGAPRGMVFIQNWIWWLKPTADHKGLASIERWKFWVVGFPYTPSFMGIKSHLLLKHCSAFLHFSSRFGWTGRWKRPEYLKTGLWKEQNMITLDDIGQSGYLEGSKILEP